MSSTGETWRLGRRPALDGLRGIAVLLVLVDHGGLVPEPAGAIGVTVFFVLSGFLVSRVVIEARASGSWSLPGFLGNRIARLYPALLVAVALCSALTLTVGQRAVPVLVQAGWSLSYLQNFAHGTAWTPFSHTWSLSVEEQFYLVLPLALPWLLRRRSPLAWVAGTVAASLALRLLVLPEGWAYVSLPSNAFALLAGVGLAVAAPRLRQLPGLAVPAGLLLLAGLVLWTPTIPHAQIVAPVLACPVAVLLVWAAVGGDALLEAAPLRFTGRISYALYLWHFPLLLLTGTALTGGRAVPVLAAAVVVATGSTLLVEEPLRRAWRLRLLRAPVPQEEDGGVASVTQDGAETTSRGAAEGAHGERTTREVCSLHHVEGAA